MKVYTFYSFKGGVGRTALLMHLAIYWANLGKVVAVVDMDLNAPGLSYSPLMLSHEDPTLEKAGMSELLATFYHSKNEETEDFKFFPPSKLLRKMNPPGKHSKWRADGQLWVLPAGSFVLPQTMEEGHDHKIPSITKQEGESFDRRALRSFAKQFKEDLSRFRHPSQPNKGIDCVLIDCRTGYPELTDLAMGFMADRVVLVSGINHQNLEGLDLTLKMLRSDRVKPGNFSNDVVIAFSPVPTNYHDNPEIFSSLQKGYHIIQKYCILEKNEIAPAVFPIPYTTRLFASDHPVPDEPILGISHPYWQALKEIAKYLEPEDFRKIITLDKMTSSVRFEEENNNHNKDFKLSNAHNLPQDHVDVLDMPKWNWPFNGDNNSESEWLEKYQINKNIEFVLDIISYIGVDIEQRVMLINKIKFMNARQIRNLIESYRVIMQNVNQFDNISLLSDQFHLQYKWGIFLCGKEKAIELFLLYPLRDKIIFKSWANMPNYWALLGEALFKEKYYSEAAQAFEIAIKFNRSKSIYWSNLAVILYYYLGRYRESEIKYREALLLGVNDLNVLLHFAGLLMDCLDKYEESETLCHQVLKLNDSFKYNALKILGVLYLRYMGRYSEAEKNLKISISGNNLEASLYLVELYWKYYNDCVNALAVINNAIGNKNSLLRFGLFYFRGCIKLILGRDWLDDIRESIYNLQNYKMDHGSFDDITAEEMLIVSLIMMGGNNDSLNISRFDDVYKKHLRYNIVRPLLEIQLKMAWKNSFEYSIDFIRTHFEYREMLVNYHLISGARTDLREDMRFAVNKLLNISQEITSRWKDAPTPASYLDRYRPFAEGKTDGAGDPRELHLFCKNYQPPGEPVHG